MAYITKVSYTDNLIDAIPLQNFIYPQTFLTIEIPPEKALIKISTAPNTESNPAWEIEIIRNGSTETITRSVNPRTFYYLTDNTTSDLALIGNTTTSDIERVQLSFTDSNDTDSLPTTITLPPATESAFRLTDFETRIRPA